jgi:hypothetical protein
MKLVFCTPAIVLSTGAFGKVRHEQKSFEHFIVEKVSSDFRNLLTNNFSKRPGLKAYVFWFFFSW